MQLDCLLDQYEFDIIHFNNGRHGFGYSEKEYAEALPRIIARIREKQPRAILILACTTPVRERPGEKAKSAANARIRERNRAMAALARELGLAGDDLYALNPYEPDAYVADGAHFTNEIRELQGRHIAETAALALEKRSKN
jgi:lysophospholipase L1-like esterase